MNKNDQEVPIAQSQPPTAAEEGAESMAVTADPVLEGTSNGNGHAAEAATSEQTVEETAAEVAMAEAPSAEGGGGAFDEAPLEEGAGEEGARKPRLFARRKSTNAELEKLKAAHEKLVSDHESLKDRYLRLAAELDNFRKRTDRDFNNRLQNAFASLIIELLPILDDLERPLNSQDLTRDYDSLLNGMMLIHQKFLKVLEDRGVKPMTTVGAEFNPLFHQAVSAKEVEGKPAGVVVEELQRGYMYNDRVLRAAQVIVSEEKKPSTTNAA
ncbi:MAG: nucleotide exchange factor GrpE [candidate division KSB1 bacterium]|nr:nucleotide exchange factor GrpE [candidate division KSB1 bacterium]MDZ7274451.1 nucleotide exchange factor GrpE [candidate division KSB1 bacterium]MDZ7284887.1 nucleotide exchange factor GrpE [candidate division KSB1 bacterium]MDZ7297692.1 nucleotide exchange factor GrpE [candidate division KSB1 bacterium]MDZ7305884.1 nucleotide exchange factor GrpE [candidate division KSB1 bacterium]